MKPPRENGGEGAFHFSIINLNAVFSLGTTE